MPKNRFPDSAGKRELRRQDGRRLAEFRLQHGFSLGLSYCGMSSIEFLDVCEWVPSLRSVFAVEVLQGVLDDMRIEWDRLNLPVPIRFCGPCNIYELLRNTNECFDLYNLDFYGGFLHVRRQATPRCIEAVRALVARQGTSRRSFALVCTFSVRDTGVREYLRFIDEVPKALRAWRNVEECCRVHKKSQATRLKLCFPYFCWDVGKSNGFSVRFVDPVVYESTVTLLHFYAEFLYQPTSLPALSYTEILAELASRPLIRLDGITPRIELKPPAISRP